jgi:hypothetical protein
MLIQTIRSLCLLVVLLCTAGNGAASTTTNEDLRAIANRIAEAHGGVERWQQLATLSVDRVHHMLADEKPFRFQIIGELSTRRIYQPWLEPGGEVVWDGERAWSNEWGFVNRFSAKFTTSIGFYLVNLPWLILDPETKLLGAEFESDILPGSDKEYLVLDIELEADSVRKPRRYPGKRDQFRLVVDKDTYLIAAVVEFRSYAGQLDMSGAGPEQSNFADIFLIEGQTKAAGLIWPEQYSLYTLSGKKYGEGRFYNYVANVPFEEQWMEARTSGNSPSQFDNTSSYLRTAPATAAVK